MKNLLLTSVTALVVLNALCACSTQETEGPSLEDLEVENASYAWGSNYVSDSPSRVGVGISRIPLEVLTEEIRVSPPAGQHKMFETAPVKRVKIVNTLGPLPWAFPKR